MSGGALPMDRLAYLLVNKHHKSSIAVFACDLEVSIELV